MEEVDDEGVLFVDTLVMQLSEADMRIAVQEYLDRRFKVSPGMVGDVRWGPTEQRYHVLLNPRGGE